jgi:hypothetical protein
MLLAMLHSLGDFSHDLRHQALVAVADYGGNAFQPRQFLRSALSITTGDYDLCRRVDSPRFADKGSRIAVGLSRDAAGIDDHDVGIRNGAFREAFGAQASAHRLAIGAGSATSKVFDVETGHPIQNSNG